MSTSIFLHYISNYKSVAKVKMGLLWRFYIYFSVTIETIHKFQKNIYGYKNAFSLCSFYSFKIKKHICTF